MNKAPEEEGIQSGRGEGAGGGGEGTLDNCLPLYRLPKSWIHYVIIFHGSNKQDDGSSIL